MELYKILAIVLGATGFWKLIELLLQYGVQKRLKMQKYATLMHKQTAL